jgi:hypothetical protein
VSGSLQDRARAISGTLALDTKAIADSSLAFFSSSMAFMARRGAAPKIPIDQLVTHN